MGEVVGDVGGVGRGGQLVDAVGGVAAFNLEAAVVEYVSWDKIGLSLTISKATANRRYRHGIKLYKQRIAAEDRRKPLRGY